MTFMDKQEYYLSELKKKSPIYYEYMRQRSLPPQEPQLFSKEQESILTEIFAKELTKEWKRQLKKLLY